jgi:hypothetical protein
MNVVKLKRRPARLECSSCGAGGEGTCDCGAPYVPAGFRAAEGIVENPEMSDRAIAEKFGVSDRTINRSRKSTATNDAVEPPPRIGRDGKKRRLPRKSKFNNNMPTEEEAEEDYQAALYDQACMLLEQMACATRQKLFAYIKRKYKHD